MPTYRRQHGHNTRRLDCWNYEGPGPYLITICTYQRGPTLGKVVNGRMVLSWAGEIVEEEWTRTDRIRPGVILDAHVIMPDHLHAIVGLGPAIGGGVRPPGLGRRPRSLGSVVAGFKAACTRRILESYGIQVPVWQPNYNDRIIRGSNHLEAVRRYVEENAMRWWLRYGG